MTRASSKPRGTASTTRLRKLECSDGCGNVARQSRAAMMRGLMGCPCGATMIPSTIEDADMLHGAGILSDELLEQHGEHAHYMRELSGILRGQASHVQRGAQTAGRLAVPEALAHARVVADRTVLADRNRLDALRVHNPRRAVVAPMPF